MVDIAEAKTNLMKLIELLETKQLDEVWICKNEEPVAKIMKFEKKNKRIGIAEGLYNHLDLDEFNSMNDEIEKEFYGEY